MLSVSNLDIVRDLSKVRRQIVSSDNTELAGGGKIKTQSGK